MIAIKGILKGKAAGGYSGSVGSTGVAGAGRINASIGRIESNPLASYLALDEEEMERSSKSSDRVQLRVVLVGCGRCQSGWWPWWGFRSGVSFFLLFWRAYLWCTLFTSEMRTPEKSHSKRRMKSWRRRRRQVEGGANRKIEREPTMEPPHEQKRGKSRNQIWHGRTRALPSEHWNE